MSQSLSEATSTETAVDGPLARQPTRATHWEGGLLLATTCLLLGHENVAVYDASMSEYAADESLPLEVD